MTANLPTPNQGELEQIKTILFACVEVGQQYPDAAKDFARNLVTVWLEDVQNIITTQVHEAEARGRREGNNSGYRNGIEVGGAITRLAQEQGKDPYKVVDDFLAALQDTTGEGEK